MNGLAPYTMTNVPGRDGVACIYIALRPLTLGGQSSAMRTVDEGGLLTRDEVEAAGVGIARMVRMGDVAVIPAEAIVALAQFLP